MNRIDPRDGLRLVHAFDVEIDHHHVVAAHQHAFEQIVGAGVDLLMRHVRRTKMKSPAGLGGKFEPLAQRTRALPRQMGSSRGTGGQATTMELRR
jgi:hypothetical protein